MTRGTGNEKTTGWSVILGEKGGKCTKTQKSHFVSGGRWGPKFPMVVVVGSEEEADEVLLFEPAIRLIMAEQNLEKQVRFALELPGSTTILSHYDGFYCVVHGRKPAIYTEYTDALAAVNVVDKPIWRKVRPFGRAIAYMLTKGESEKPHNKDWQDILNALSEVTMEHPATSPRAGRTQSETASEYPAPPADRVTPAAETVHWSQEQQDYVVPSSSASRIPTPAFPSTALFQDPTFNQYVLDSPRRVPDIGPAYVYQHVRTLRGITASHTVPLADETQTPSCGSPLDMFLQAMGYDVPSKLTVARAVQSAMSMGEFVGEMCRRGLPALEAKYMWYLHSLQPRHATWSETLIM